MKSESASYRSLFAINNIPLVLGAACMSRLASRMFTLVIILYALSRFGSPELAGWLTFAAIAPGLLISPVSGAFLDRIGAHRSVVVDMIVSALLIMGLVLVEKLQLASQATVLLLVGVYSLTSPLSAAGIRTLLPRLVQTTDLDRINAVDTAIYAAVDVLGPALAGVLFSFFGGMATFSVIAVAYGIAAFCMYPIQLPQQSTHHTGSIWRQTWDGITLVVRQPTLRGLAVSYSLYQMTWGALVIVVPVIVGLHFSSPASERITGMLWAIVGISGGAGALVVGRFRTMGRERAVMAIGMAATAVASWPIATYFGPAGVVIGLVVAGIAVGPIDVGLLTLRQRRTDPSKLGRVLSVSMSLNLSGFPIGSAIAGLLVSVSPGATFLFAAVTTALAALLVSLIPAD
ncbi:MFS transporter [Paraburkholderia agricolaris]|uniref:MFS transporter n=1 Tax=Paraburkholderia agricolaris TaxID=2152888 RepID=A0ABW9A148_9BURK